MPDNTSIHPHSAHLEHLVDTFTFQGRPVNRDEDREVLVLVNHGYVVGYSPDRLQPVWAAYRVAGMTEGVDFDRPHLYYEDKRLEEKIRLGPETFGKHDQIQYHVGHMVPNEVINRQYGRLAQTETFFMSNMSPQRGSLNTGLWLKLETAIRNIEDKEGKDHVWVVAGPIFGADPATIDRGQDKHVPIPDAYYCITLDPFRYPWNRQSNVDVACFIFKQEAPGGDDLDEYERGPEGLEEIEEATNLTFFPGWRSDLEGEEVVDSATSARTRHRLLSQLGR